MSKTIIRRLEALEKEHRAREHRELTSFIEARMYIWRTVLAYYLGDLKPNENYVSDANARALKYESGQEFFEVILELEKNDIHTGTDIPERYWDAYHRLFKKVGLDFDKSSPDVLFAASSGQMVE
jgi:hypothetical protein